NTKDIIINFWSKNNVFILSFILAIYILPYWFSYPPTTVLDGSWVRAINLAIKNKLTFGTGFIFTYGPLGYLSTRNTQYIPSIVLLLTDIFCFVCFYILFYKILSQYKNWFFILLVAVLFFKGTEYTETLFLLFIAFSITSLKNGFKKDYEIVICGICGVLVFFMKVNYGLIAAPLMLILCIYLGIKKIKSFAIFLFTILFVF